MFHTRPRDGVEIPAAAEREARRVSHLTHDTPAPNRDGHLDATDEPRHHQSDFSTTPWQSSPRSTPASQPRPLFLVRPHRGVSPSPIPILDDSTSLISCVRQDNPRSRRIQLEDRHDNKQTPCQRAKISGGTNPSRNTHRPDPPIHSPPYRVVCDVFTADATM